MDKTRKEKLTKLRRVAHKLPCLLNDEQIEKIIRGNLSTEELKKDPMVAYTLALISKSKEDKAYYAQIIVDSKNPMLNYLCASKFKDADLVAHGLSIARSNNEKYINDYALMLMHKAIKTRDDKSLVKYNSALWEFRKALMMDKPVERARKLEVSKKDK